MVVIQQYVLAQNASCAAALAYPPASDASRFDNADVHRLAIRLAQHLVERAVVGGVQRARGAVGGHAGVAGGGVDVTWAFRPWRRNIGARSGLCCHRQRSASQRERQCEYKYRVDSRLHAYPDSAVRGLFRHLEFSRFRGCNANKSRAGQPGFHPGTLFFLQFERASITKLFSESDFTVRPGCGAVRYKGLMFAAFFRGDKRSVLLKAGILIAAIALLDWSVVGASPARLPLSGSHADGGGRAQLLADRSDRGCMHLPGRAL